MYPATYFGLFPPFPHDDRVFVAMSFDDLFLPRWRTVIEPAIAASTFEGRPLQPHRVDARHVSDSILTEILQGISQSRLVFVDITTIERVGECAIRNANVMYELGLAHAARLPEEVLVFRSDDDSLPFDTVNFRVNPYAPDTDPEQAVRLVKDSIADALREIVLRRTMTVKRIAESLDFDSWTLLAEAMGGDGLTVPPFRTFGEAVGGMNRLLAIPRLLEFGAIRVEYPEVLHTGMDNDSMRATFRYRATALGEEVFLSTGEYMRFEGEA